MISPENARKFLEQHKPSQLAKQDFAGFSTAYSTLGMLVANLFEYNKAPSVIGVFETYFKKTTNPWSTEEGQRLAVLLFGEAKSGLVPAVWDLINRLPFQGGYNRRPFRTEREASYLSRKLSLLQQLFHSSRAGFCGLGVEDTARYDAAGGWQNSHSGLWFAAGLEAEPTDGPFFQLLEDILQGEDDIGGVSRGIIQGLLIADRPAGWQLVERLLLAAQRQEGLRQTILEVVDECHPGAFRHLIGVILEHDLARFSSVVRAVDTWFGFGWEAPKKKTIERILSLAQMALDAETDATSLLNSKDNLEAYVGLWGLAVKELNEAITQAANLLLKADRPVKLLAAYFLYQTGYSNAKVGEWVIEYFGKDLELDYWVSLSLPSKMPLTDHSFTCLRQHAEALPTEGKVFPSSAFSWLAPKIMPEYFYNFIIRHGNQEDLIKLGEDISRLPSASRETYFRQLFPNHRTYRLQYDRAGKVKEEIDLEKDPWKRKLIHQAVSDRNASVMATGMKLLQAIPLGEAERTLVVELLRRKGKHFRAGLIKIILQQPPAVIRELVDALLAGKSVDQRLAGLEVLTILHADNRLLDYINTKIPAYRERTTLTKNEQVFLEKFRDQKSELSRENGFGLIDFSQLSTLPSPQLKFKESGKKGGLLQRLVGRKTKFLFADFIDAKKISRAINDLVSRYQANAQYEYEAYYRAEFTQTVLLGDSIHFTQDVTELSPKKRLAFLPKADVWQDWYDQSGLNDFELLMAIHHTNKFQSPYGQYQAFIPFLQQYIPEVKDLNLSDSKRYNSYNRRISQLLSYFYAAYADGPTMLRFKLDVLEDAIARLPANLRKEIVVQPDGYYQPHKAHWVDILPNALPGSLDYNHPAIIARQDPEDMHRFWQLTNVLLAARALKTYPNASLQPLLASKLPGRSSRPPEAWLSILLHEEGKITEADLHVQTLLNGGLLELLESGGRRQRVPEAFQDRVPQGVFAPLKKNLLAVELERGELATDASAYVAKFREIAGANYLINLVQRLGKTPLERGYSYSSDLTQKSIFSALIKNSVAEESDTVPDFIKAAKASKVPKKRWLEIAMYAPQWAPWIGELLRIEDLEGAVWWFHAHATEYSNQDKQAIVARFSPIEHQDFRAGAIDLHWFHEAYAAVGKQHWRMLHEAAKYVSDGNGHRQVKTYSAVMLGEIKIREALKKIKEKRDKVFVKALGLIPLSRTNPRKDVLNRYNLLQNFRREAKQFGAQRQASERQAVEIGLDNLARNAGYADTIQFSWVMEGEATRAIMEKSALLIDNVFIELRIDEQGRAGLHVAKEGKSQKSIPAKYRKHKAVTALKESKAALRKQYQRTRASLENAMVSSRVFSTGEMMEIFDHPIVRAMLAKLVLYAPAKGVAGFWADGRLQAADGALHVLQDADELLIAHPAHLYRLVEWDRYQAYAFNHQLVQPFKQIFRELYLVTANEREEKFKSSRYQGHQVQPKKTAALLRGRGWVADRDSGLQKVFHQRNIVATIYAMADWFSPAEIEAPTLEHVAFYSRKNYEHLPLEDIDPVLFSEVMRDVDLVVSVAHVGQVDPEASHSSMEMRGALARESARLFKADNVEVKERHIIITGKLGTYSIHLGSGKVSRNGMQLSIIPVHSQHRGRLFLPFIDDDPKSAEIISKMRMLAKDDKIQDPTVLAQIAH